MNPNKEEVLPFDAKDPFPLFDLDQFSYSSQQKHSEAVDRWLGFDVDQVEADLQARIHEPFDRKELWVGLKPSALQTPYTEIRQILSRVQWPPSGTVIDLGAGYGRMAHVLAAHFPGSRFIGYELSLERVKEGSRILRAAGISEARAQLIHQDLAAPEFELLQANLFFIYDFGTKASIETVLQKLQVIARGQRICVVGRGRSSRDLIEQRHPWLSQVIPPIHENHFSIYQSRTF